MLHIDIGSKPNICVKATLYPSLEIVLQIWPDTITSFIL